MKKLLLMVGVALGVLTAGSSAHAAENPDYTKGSGFDASKCYWATVNAAYDYTDAYKFFDLVNDYREENGLDRVPTNDYCMRLAMQRALECNVKMSHTSPWRKGDGGDFTGAETASILGLYNCTGDVAQDIKNGRLKFTAQENCHSWGGQTFDISTIFNDQIAAGTIDHAVTYPNATAIGIGVINDVIVVVAFKKADILELSTDSRTLTNYSAVMKVPVIAVEADVDGWEPDSPDFVKVDKSTYCNGTKNEDEEEDEDEEEEKEEKKASSESKTVKSTKVSGVKVTRKKAGKYTKLTVKFSKVKKVKSIKYQVQVAKNKKFKSAKKATTSSTKKTFSINYKGKKAYIRVRCYKKINGKTVYGKWSGIKTIKTYK